MDEKNLTKIDYEDKETGIIDEFKKHSISVENLQNESTSAFVLEDKDVAGGSVNVRVLESIVKKHKIKEIRW